MRAGLLSLAAAASSKASKASPSPKKSPSPKPSAAPPLPKKKTAAAPPKKTSPANPEKRADNPLLRVCNLSPALSSFLEITETTRNDALKRVWEYIKSQNLQNKLDKKEIICDEKLKVLFGRERVTNPEVIKFLSPHLLKKE